MLSLRTKCILKNDFENKNYANLHSSVPTDAMEN